jgi:hypothetical protein
MEGCGLTSCGSGYGSVLDSRDHAIESSGFIIYGEVSE